MLDPLRASRSRATSAPPPPPRRRCAPTHATTRCGGLYERAFGAPPPRPGAAAPRGATPSASAAVRRRQGSASASGASSRSRSLGSASSRRAPSRGRPAWRRPRATRGRRGCPASWAATGPLSPAALRHTARPPASSPAAAAGPSGLGPDGAAIPGAVRPARATTRSTRSSTPTTPRFGPAVACVGGGHAARSPAAAAHARARRLRKRRLSAARGGAPDRAVPTCRSAARSPTRADVRGCAEMLGPRNRGAPTWKVLHSKARRATRAHTSPPSVAVVHETTQHPAASAAAPRRARPAA